MEANTKRLRLGSLSLKEAYGQAMGVTAPLGSVVSTTTAAVAFVGEAVPLATAVAMLVSVVWLFLLTRYTSRVASAGGFYSFAGFAYRKKWLSFFEAMTEIGAFVVLNAADVYALYLMLEVLSDLFGLRIPLYILIVFASSAIWLPTLISLLDVRTVMSKVVFYSASAEVAFLIAFFAYTVVTRGFSLAPMDPRAFSRGGFSSALLLSVTSIGGAGTSTYLAEETRRPTRNVTLGIWLAAALGGAAMFLGSYAMVMDWGGSLSSLANSPQPLLQEVGAIPPIGGLAMLLTTVLAINSLLISNVGTTLSAARTMFNLGREEALPSFLTYLNRELEPAAATLLVGLAGVAITVLCLPLGPERAFSEVSLVASFFWVLGRTVDALGLPWFYRRFGGVPSWVWLLASAAFGLNALALISVLYPFEPFAASFIGIYLMASLIFYFAYGRKGKPGSLFVTERGELVEHARGLFNRCWAARR